MSFLPDHTDLQQERLCIEQAKKEIGRFEPIYRRYYEPIFRFIYRRTDDEVLTGDLCSQTFYKAMTNLERFEWRGKPILAWLYTIALNEIKKHYRNQKPVFIIEEDKILDTTELRDEWLNTSHDKLIKLLDQLSESELQLIELKYFEGTTFKEIAVLMDITESAAKMKLYRLLSKLKQRLEVQHD